MTPEEIAQVAHEVNRTYCQAIGDNSQPAWKDAPGWQLVSAVNGVNFHLANPGSPPSRSHEEWMKQKEAEGWKYGIVKDEAAKLHPCFLPYEELPLDQKVKDYLFSTIVNQLAPFVERQVGSVFVPFTNTDCTEGRGMDIAVATCRVESTARRLARRNYVQGTDGPVKEVPIMSYHGLQVIPLWAVNLVQPSGQDELVNIRLKRRKEALAKLADAGLTEADIAALTVTADESMYS